MERLKLMALVVVTGAALWVFTGARAVRAHGTSDAA